MVIGLLRTDSQDIDWDGSEHWDDPRTAGRLQIYISRGVPGKHPQNSKAKERKKTEEG